MDLLGKWIRFSSMGNVCMTRVLLVQGMLKTFVLSSCETERASFACVKNKDPKG